MKVTRAEFAAAAGAFSSIGIVRYPAGAAEFSYKLSHIFPTSSPISQHLTQMAETVLRETGGQFEFRIFPSSQLGGDAEVLSQVRSGATEFALIVDLVTGALVPPVGVTSVPFIVSSLAEAFKIMTGPYYSYVLGLLEKDSVYAFQGSWDAGGFRQLVTSNRVVSAPADCKGLKIRASQTPSDIAAITAFGGSPVAMAQLDVYPSLQTHLVDGTIAGTVATQQYKFFEVTKYLALINFGLGFSLMLANRDAWQRVPQNIQNVVARNLELARTASNADVATLIPKALDFLKSSGMQVNTPDIAPFHKAVRDAGLFAQWKATYGPTAWSLLEKSIGRTIS